MVRTVKAKVGRPLGKKDRVLLLPGPTGAEPWEVWVVDNKSNAEHRQSYASPLDLRFRKNATLVLPASQVFCLPLWLNETDATQLGAMIPLQ